MSNRSLIRIATLGQDPALAELSVAAERSEYFQNVGCFDASSDNDRGAIVDDHRDEESWEVLLSNTVAEWVAVSSMPSDAAAAIRRAEQLKRLIQAGVSLILVHPPCDMLLAYELEMHRGDGGARILPYCPTMDHPELQALCAAVANDDAPFGEVEQCLFERRVVLEQRQRNDVLAHVARDALIVRRLLGDVSSVSATGVASDAGQWTNLGIHYTGPQPRIARWAMGPARDQAGLKLTLIGEQKSVSAWIPDQGHRLEWSETLQLAPAESDDWHPADQFLHRLAHKTYNTPSGSNTSWDEVCRALEATDAVQRSIQRKRTIELYHEQVTEQETFKSMMAAGGCGMLLWVLLLLLVAGVVEGLKLPLRDTFIWRLWPVFLFAPLAVFLALQLLQLVFPHPTRNTSSSPTED